jgi:hypothetical protein
MFCIAAWADGVADEGLRDGGGGRHLAVGVLLRELDGLALDVPGVGEGLLEARDGRVERRRLHELADADLDRVGTGAGVAAVRRAGAQCERSGCGQADEGERLAAEAGDCHGVSSLECGDASGGNAPRKMMDLAAPGDNAVRCPILIRGLSIVNLPLIF